MILELLVFVNIKIKVTNNDGLRFTNNGKNKLNQEVTFFIKINPL